MNKEIKLFNRDAVKYITVAAKVLNHFASVCHIVRNTILYGIYKA